MSSGRVRIGQLQLDPVTFDQALERIVELVDAREGGSVFTPNVDHVVKAETNDAFRAAYERADLCLVDGMWLLWASRLLNAPLPEKVSGSDLVGPLCKLAAGATVACVHPGRRPWRRRGTPLQGCPAISVSTSWDGIPRSYNRMEAWATRMRFSAAFVRPNPTSC